MLFSKYELSQGNCLNIQLIFVKIDAGGKQGIITGQHLWQTPAVDMIPSVFNSVTTRL